jgi:hypothetical protein
MLFIQINGHLIHCGYQGIFTHKPINAAKLKPKKLSDCRSGDDRRAMTLNIRSGKISGLGTDPGHHGESEKRQNDARVARRPKMPS